MKNAWTSLLLGVLLASCNAPPKLVWADEFDLEGVPDSTKWSYDLGDGCPHVCGWGNNEAQYYTQRTKNVRIENGNLVIEAHQDSINGRAYSSARIISKHKVIGYTEEWKHAPNYQKAEARGQPFGCYRQIGNMADGPPVAKLISWSM